ncbi:hypothetical protein EV204_1088 [Tissierella praeacuta]|nr:hypothetical protein [Tissierella praeacuta]TCU69651.1 hypothetical protein EV204_1088 [Tissierella praeacuta]
MKKKKEPLKVIIVNPEAIPMARDRLTLALLELIENKKIREIQEV